MSVARSHPPPRGTRDLVRQLQSSLACPLPQDGRERRADADGRHDRNSIRDRGPHQATGLRTGDGRRRAPSGPGSRGVFRRGSAIITSSGNDGPPELAVGERHLPHPSGRSLFMKPRVDLCHQDRPKRKLPSLGFSRQAAQISAGGSDGGAALKDTADNDGRVGLAHHGLRLLPGAGTDSEHRPHDRGRREEIPPIRNSALGVVDDIGASAQHHSQGIGSLGKLRWLRFWLRPRRPAFSKARFKIN